MAKGRRGKKFLRTRLTRPVGQRKETSAWFTGQWTLWNWLHGETESRWWRTVLACGWEQPPMAVCWPFFRLGRVVSQAKSQSQKPKSGCSICCWGIWIRCLARGWWDRGKGGAWESGGRLRQDHRVGPRAKGRSQVTNSPSNGEKTQIKIAFRFGRCWPFSWFGPEKSNGG